MLFEVRVSFQKDHIASLQVCLVMFVCGQNGIDAARLLWCTCSSCIGQVLLAAQVKGHI